MEIDWRGKNRRRLDSWKEPGAHFSRLRCPRRSCKEQGDGESSVHLQRLVRSSKVVRGERGFPT